MSSCRTAVAALALLTCTAPLAHAQAPLAWKLRKGDQFTLAIATDARDTVSIAGQRNETRMKMAVGFDVTVREAPRGGDPKLALRITFFDASGSKNAEAMAKFGKAIKGQELLATVDRGMKLKSLTGIDTLVRKVAELEGAPPMGVDLVEKALTVLFRLLLEEAFVAVPEKATARGDTWKQTTEANLLGLGTLLTNKTFTDEGDATVGGRTVRKAGIQATQTFAAAKGGAPALFPGTIDKLELKNQRYKGTLNFDPEAGRPVSVDSRVEMDIVMTLTVNGMTFDGEGRREQSFRIRFGDKKAAE